MRLIYALLGYAKIKINSRYTADFLNLCMSYRIPYTELKDVGDYVFVKMKYYDYKRFLKASAVYEFQMDAVKFCGIPFLFLKNKFRFGLLFGALFSLVIVTYFSSIIWDIRIKGNENITTGEILEILDGHGVSVGRKYSEIDVDLIQNQILLDSEEISYISINLSGNVVNVEMRERRIGQEQLSGGGFANVVAKKSGIIENVRAYVGNVVVKSGQLVNEGELLISGIYDSKTQGIRYTRASGDIMARTVEEYYIEIPLKYEKKEYTGAVNYEKNLNFFDKTFNIFKKYRNELYLYDIIYSVDNFGLSFGELPIGITSVSFHEYRNVDATRTPEEAERLAYSELERRISSSGAEFLVKKTVKTSLDEEKFTIHCVVVYIENIAQTSEFSVDLEN